MDIKYRLAQEADAPAILALYRVTGWWKMDENPAYLDTIKGIIANSFIFIVAQDGDEIIGMGRVISDGVSDAFIQDITVLERYRGNGIGRAIIRYLVNHLQENKLQWIGLISEPGYQGFYQSLGFGEMKGYTPFLLEQ